MAKCSEQPSLRFEVRQREDGRKVLYMHTKRGIRIQPEQKAGAMMNFTMQSLAAKHGWNFTKLYSMNLTNDSHV